MEERLKSHYESLSRVVSFTRTADTKAAPVLALQVALTGALATRIDKLIPIVGSSHLDAEGIALIVVLSAYVLLIERQLIDQIYQVSRVASLKMRRARWAIWLSLPTVVLGFTLLAWSST